MSPYLIKAMIESSGLDIGGPYAQNNILQNFTTHKTYAQGPL